jgi:hypothetical protein
MSIRKLTLFILLLFSLVFLAGCQPSWQVSLTVNGKEIGQIIKSDVQFYIDKSEEEIESVPLGQFFYDNGFGLIDLVDVQCEDANLAYYRWDDIAESADLNVDKKLTIDGESCPVESIEVTPSPTAEHIELSIMDIAPTIAYALGLPELPDVIGTPILETSAENAVLIILDGTQYAKLQYEIATGGLPFLASVGNFKNGLTVYPPITTTATASLLTGAPPKDTKVYGYGYRGTDLTTLFDLAIENGLSAHAVEGASLPFNLRNAEVTLSGDRDKNGYSDDNVFTNALNQIGTDLPNLLYIHFHEIDDMGHTYGPESTEYIDAMIRVDGYLEGIVNALPEGTLIMITADHGMHETVDGGNHGTLTEKDMIIPIIYIEK